MVLVAIPFTPQYKTHYTLILKHEFYQNGLYDCIHWFEFLDAIPQVCDGIERVLNECQDLKKIGRKDMMRAMHTP
jgi:hypothetical protein